MTAFFADFPWQTWVVQFGSRLGMAILVLAGFWLAARLAGYLLPRLSRRWAGQHLALLELGARCSSIALKVMGVVTALGTLGVDVSALVAGLGLTGFALGFALKDALSNVLAGVMILFYRPFRIGEYIAAAGFEGLVTAIDLRYTTLQITEKRVLIPNASLLTNAIVVHPRPPVP